MPYQYVREPLTARESDRLSNACETPTERLVVWTLLDTGLRVALGPPTFPRCQKVGGRSLGNHASLVEPVGEGSFPATLRPGIGGHDQNSIRRNALMPMCSGIKVPRMPTIRLAMIAIDSQNRKPLWDMAMLADSGCSWPAK